MGMLQALEDSSMLEVLGQLDARSLGNLASTCRAMYCFANHEEVWKALTLEVRLENTEMMLPIFCWP